MGRAQRQPLPLTYIAAFGAREDYQPHAEGLAATLETVASRFRSGEGGEERRAVAGGVTRAAANVRCGGPRCGR